MDLVHKISGSRIFETVADYLDVSGSCNWTEIPENIQHRIAAPLKILDIYHYPNTNQYEFLFDKTYQILGSMDISSVTTDIESWKATHNPKIGDEVYVLLSPPCKNPYIDELDDDNQGIIKQNAETNPKILVAKIYYLEIFKE